MPAATLAPPAVPRLTRGWPACGWATRRACPRQSERRTLKPSDFPPNCASTAWAIRAHPRRPPRCASQSNIMLMGAMGSGTSWQPSSGPMNMYYKVAGDWLLMFHFNLAAGLNRQGGPRGATMFDSQNWFMPMAYHKLGRGTLQLRGMFSAEPFTFPPGGSPLLFQTGETYKGQPLIDKQHPHDLFMELSAQYTNPLGERGTRCTYFRYPGEPALGPVAFMHRASASENPSATLAHHLQDSTH